MLELFSHPVVNLLLRVAWFSFAGCFALWLVIRIDVWQKANESKAGELHLVTRVIYYASKVGLFFAAAVAFGLAISLLWTRLTR